MMTNNGPLDAERDPLSIGVFMPNCSYSCSISTYKPVPDDWTFESNVAIAQAAEQVGFDFLFPVAKWRGYGGPTNYLGTSLETMTWAAGLLAQTKGIHVSSTVHVPIFHPFVVAKMGGTLDHIGQGRWGLNVVSGWSEREFGQMHVPILPHGERYRRTADYIEVLKGLWTAEPGTFNHHSEWYDVTDGWVSPLPVRKPHPPIANAGVSADAKEVVARLCDWAFISLPSIEAAGDGRRTSAAGLRNTAARSAARPIHSPSGARRSARLSKSGAASWMRWTARRRRTGHAASSATAAPSIASRSRCSRSAGAGCPFWDRRTSRGEDRRALPQRHRRRAAHLPRVPCRRDPFREGDPAAAPPDGSARRP